MFVSTRGPLLGLRPTRSCMVLRGLEHGTAAMLWAKVCSVRGDISFQYTAMSRRSNTNRLVLLDSEHRLQILQQLRTRPTL